ncbi:uncharacterized protein PHACADRAFT_28936 [Phanerochaete carnosa HHB-10118-sp]|uniref:Uncharacterized protein n=1 Tax=Phanerochaete carnosa (strain HHB-10118-sp) TaxID=650164 RepID=K5WAF5_PHACS|nr:uncharacterized protein PHACADRAFT_28936 [Phanerochaete carnosa HHB-10118-sp]EKM55949.1 hypothetical protein PHACADRAFT_28936 [Phanerochaete carnosa HHB-10118-sp]
MDHPDTTAEVRKTPYGLVSKQSHKHSKLKIRLSPSSSPPQSAVSKTASKAGDKTSKAARKTVHNKPPSQPSTSQLHVPQGVSAQMPDVGRTGRHGRRAERERSWLRRMHDARPDVHAQEEPCATSVPGDTALVPAELEDDESDDAPLQRRLSKTLVPDTKQGPTKQKPMRQKHTRQEPDKVNLSRRERTKHAASGTSITVGDDPQPSVSGASGIESAKDVQKLEQQDTAGRDTRFKRLRRAREVFFEQLKSTMDKSVMSDELDQLYVVAMTWRSYEDLLWPSELQ